MTKMRAFNLSKVWTPFSNEQSLEISSIFRNTIQPHEKYVKRTRKAYKNVSEAQSSTLAKKKVKKLGKLAKKLKQRQAALVQVNSNLTPDQLNQLKHNILVGYLFKRHFRFGVNTVTRVLENSSKCANCLFVLVFPANSLPKEDVQAQQQPSESNQTKSAPKANEKIIDKSLQTTSSKETPSVSAINQFNFLTRHIRTMCIDMDIPTGCLSPNVSSSFLSKFFNMNRISVIALLNKSDENEAELPKNVIDDLKKLSEKHGLPVSIDADGANQLLEYYNSYKNIINREVESAVQSIGVTIRNLLPKIEEKSSFEKQLNISKMLQINTPKAEILMKTEVEAHMQCEPSQIKVDRIEEQDSRSDEEVFGSDFINVDKNSIRKKLETNFDDTNFILFNS